MHRILICTVVFLMIVLPRASLSFPPNNQDCSQCHSLKKEEAETLLRGFNKNIKVLSVGRSKAQYLWEVSYESEGKKGLAYVDLPKKYLISGSVLDLRSKKNFTQEKLSELNRVTVAQIPIKDALVVGNRNAKQKVIVFDDPE